MTDNLLNRIAKSIYEAAMPHCKGEYNGLPDYAKAEWVKMARAARDEVKNGVLGNSNKRLALPEDEIYLAKELCVYLGECSATYYLVLLIQEVEYLRNAIRKTVG